MKSVGMQVGIGLWLAIAVFLGLVQRSWDTFFGFAGVALFFAGVALAGVAIKSKRKPVRVLGALGVIAFVAVIVGLLLSGAERLYLVNGSHYPSFMASDLGAVDSKRMDEIRATSCPNAPLEIFEKGNAQNRYWVIRCGFAYYEGHTYISHTHPYANLMHGGADNE